MPVKAKAACRRLQKFWKAPYQQIIAIKVIMPRPRGSHQMVPADQIFVDIERGKELHSVCPVGVQQKAWQSGLRCLPKPAVPTAVTPKKDSVGQPPPGDELHVAWRQVGKWESPEAVHSILEQPERFCTRQRDPACVCVYACLLVSTQEHTHVYTLCIGSDLKKEKKSLVEPRNSKQMLAWPFGQETVFWI